MKSFLIRLAICSLGLFVAEEIVPGVRIDDAQTLVLSAFLLGLVNAVVKPLAVVLTLPITILTLGLFLLVVNAAMLGLVASLLSGFQIAGFGSALLASIVVSVVSWFASHFFAPTRAVQVEIHRG